MNKKAIITIISLFIIVIVSSVYCYINVNNSYEKYINMNPDKHIDNNFLTIMLEQDDGTYQKITSNDWPGDGYIFNPALSKCENGGELTWDSDNNIVKMSGVTADNCYVYFDKVPTLAEYIINKYTGTQGENEIYHHTSSLANSAEDNSYRYAGANPNNYVCFGSEETTCPEDNLYRIIGVFENKVKLIKNTSIGNYVWDSGNSNVWDPNSDTYPDIRTTLNSTFLNTLNSTWQNKIATHAYKVGGGSYTYLRNGTAKTAYNYEVGSNSSSTIDSMKIGLMYVSDYGFGASPDYWTTILSNYHGGTQNNNWIYIGGEWTITRVSDTNNASYRVFGALGSGIGHIGYNNNTTASLNVRPVFYLNSNIQYVSGDGSINNPFRIN